MWVSVLHLGSTFSTSVLRRWSLEGVMKHNTVLVGVLSMVVCMFVCVCVCDTATTHVEFGLLIRVLCFC